MRAVRALRRPSTGGFKRPSNDLIAGFAGLNHRPRARSPAPRNASINAPRYRLRADHLCPYKAPASGPLSHTTGLVQQRDKVAAARDLSFNVEPSRYAANEMME
jgi:hypothetical protein